MCPGEYGDRLGDVGVGRQPPVEVLVGGKMLANVRFVRSPHLAIARTILMPHQVII